jgi:hypothetical protein
MRKKIYALLFLSVYLVLEVLTYENISVLHFSIAKVLDLSYVFLSFLMVEKLLAIKHKYAIHRHLFYGTSIILFIFIFIISKFLLVVLLPVKIHSYINSDLYFAMSLIASMYFTLKFYRW